MLWREIGVILLLLLLNGFFAMSEMALVSSKRSRLQALAEQGKSGAKSALALLEDPTTFLSAIQIGITLIGLVTGVYSGATLAAPLADQLLVLGVPLMLVCARKYPTFFSYRPDPPDLVKDPTGDDTLAAPLGTYRKGVN